MENKIKDTLLKSGIPLEVSVVDKLSEHGFNDQGEIEYRRDGKLFSTDIKATKEVEFNTDAKTLLTLAVECKFRTPNHDWFFLKFPRKSKYEFRQDVGLMSFSYIERISNQSEYSEYESAVKTSKRVLESTEELGEDSVDKGVEIIDENQFKHSSIRKAVNQSVFGALKAQKEGMHFNTDVLSDSLDQLEWEKPVDSKNLGDPLATYTLPIVVTTANLYKVKESTMLEDVRSSEDPINLFKEVKAITYPKSDYEETRKFRDKLFDKENTSFYDRMKEIQEFLPTDLEEKIGQDFNLSKPSNCSNVYIINYEYLDEILDNFTTKLEDLEVEKVNQPN